jgi:hypothetical protein
MFDKRTTIVMVSLIAFSMFYTTFFMDISDARLTGNQFFAHYGSGGTFFANGTNHTECIGNACVVVSGNGTNECQTNLDCRRSYRRYMPVKHNVCQGNACVTVNGTGTNQCWSNADCNTTNKSMPDLIVDYWWWNSTGNTTNSTGGNQTNVTVHVGIRNIGNAIAGSTYTLINGTTYNWIFFAEPNYRHIWTPSINVGQTVFVETSFLFTSGLGYSGDIMADAFNGIQELDETNNNDTIWLNP